ncbi:MAG TPA: hypothetical protein VN227_05805 [Methanoregula sp.]|nr:hypothetical protein [Methanoregula sp.]
MTSEDLPPPICGSPYSYLPFSKNLWLKLCPEESGPEWKSSGSVTFGRCTTRCIIESSFIHVTVVPSLMLIVEGSKALALIITVTVPVSGTPVVIRVTIDVSLELDVTEVHPQINAPEINTISRIAEFFMKERMDVNLIILFP